ncbi:hypothetical protein MRB53_037836 [Persea americana]|nr:hypothetical protein MRB53_037836 [Persea americana]
MYSIGWKAMDHGIVRFLAISALISRCHGIGSIIPSNASIPVNDLHATSTSVMLGITQGYSQTQYALLEVLHLMLPTPKYQYVDSFSSMAQLKEAGLWHKCSIVSCHSSEPDSESIQSITFISCDPSDYVGSIGSLNVGPSDIADAVEKENHRQCCYLLLTDRNFLQSTVINEHHVAICNTLFNASLAPITIPRNATDKASGSNDQPPVQGTAVAMIVLYAITGLVTSLFIFIIITGAIKARRHPERYGPRTQPGRRRQTRAGGLARAILETIPVVKFGEPDAKTSDVELTAPSVSDINQAQHNQ